MSLFPRAAESALANVPRSKGSKVFVVDYVNGSDSNPGTKWDAPLKTVAAAYALCTTLKNDSVLVVGNGTANLQTAAITWGKDYTHLIGLTAQAAYAPRAVVQCPAAMATTPFVTFTASGCIVSNVTFWHTSTNAASLVNVAVSGAYNQFSGVHFAGALGANNASGARSLVLTGATCIGNLFKDCVIGDDTTALVTGAADMAFISAPSRNRFDDCTFRHQANATTTTSIICALAADMGRGNLFRRCLFENSKTSVAQAEVWTNGQAFVEPARPLMLDCWMYGIAKWDANNRGVITNITIAANTTGVNTGNTMVVTSA